MVLLQHGESTRCLYCSMVRARDGYTAAW